jgi:hypothetical protein
MNIYLVSVHKVPFTALYPLRKLLIYLGSLCKKTPTTTLLSFLKQSFTICKLLGFKNFESLVFGAFLSKTENFVVFLLVLGKIPTSAEGKPCK